MGTDERTGVHGIEANDRTRINQPREERQPTLDARHAFALAYDKLGTLAEIARTPGVIAVAVSARGRVVDALLLGDGEALVIGRHSACGLRLADAGVALRHLAAHVLAPENGPATVRLWDLNTGQSFLTEDGTASAALIAEGLLYAAVGPYALLFVPTGALAPGRTATEAWDALPPRQFIDHRQSEPLQIFEPLESSLRTSSRVTQVRAATHLGEGAGPTWAELRILYGKDRQKTVPVALEHVMRGVLIGRYDRCGVQLTLDDNVSRVHLLLVRIGVEVWAIDTASTNGSRRATDEPFGAVRLGDEDWIELGETHIRLNLHRLQHAAA